MTKQQSWINALIALALVTLCVVVRLMVAEGVLRYNFAAIASASLFAGYVLKSRWLAISIPISVLLVSGVIPQIGFPPVTTFTVVCAALIAPVFAGAWLARKPRTTSFMVGGLCISAMGASMLFFLVTNFETWLTWGMYDKSLGGLARCYIAALPFFKWTLASNVVFTTAFFGSAAIAPVLRSSLRPVKVPAR